MGAAVIALLWANSPMASSYFSLWDTRLSVGIGDSAISMNLLHWINDGLMAIFFLVVGLEIKREVLVGELASVRRAALPIAAAFGTALVPALVFLLIVGSGEGARGWAVPMATLDRRVGRAVLATLVIGSYMALGFAFGLGPETYLLLGIPITMTFQVGLSTRPSRLVDRSVSRASGWVLG